jgi:hypothetical protein
MAGPLVTALFGFVCHPLLCVGLVLTQIGWSMFVFDPAAHDSSISPAVVVTCLCSIVTLLWKQCQERGACLFVPQWTLARGSVFQGQLMLGMPVLSQIVCGFCMGLLVSKIDETDFFASLVAGDDELVVGNSAVRGRAAHAHQEHLIIYLAFLLHGWIWSAAAAYILGEWSNAATLHSAEPDLHFN